MRERLPAYVLEVTEEKTWRVLRVFPRLLPWQWAVYHDDVIYQYGLTKIPAARGFCRTREQAQTRGEAWIFQQMACDREERDRKQHKTVWRPQKE